MPESAPTLLASLFLSTLTSLAPAQAPVVLGPAPATPRLQAAADGVLQGLGSDYRVEFHTEAVTFVPSPAGEQDGAAKLAFALTASRSTANCWRTRATSRRWCR